MIGWSPLESLESPQVKASAPKSKRATVKSRVKKKPTSVPISGDAIDAIELSNSVH